LHFRGCTQIRAGLIKPSEKLFIDFHVKQISYISFNGISVKPQSVFLQQRIQWPVEHQKIGLNIVFYCF